MNNSKNVLNYIFGNGSFIQLKEVIDKQRKVSSGDVLYFVDEYFKDKKLKNQIPSENNDSVVFVNTETEIDTDLIDKLTTDAKSHHGEKLAIIVGIGGGSILDVAKAVSNLYTNGGRAEDYQGWDLVRIPGIYKIGIPTLAGTGAEASRTCVMMNRKKNLKLGMNSEHTIYDQLIMDPDLTITVPRDQYFYTGMDTYIHCLESLEGSHRHVLADAFSRESLRLCEEIFLSDDMQSDLNREKMMTSSYLGGCAIANSFVGVVHPFSAGLSVVLDYHHCIANCIVMNHMEEFYPEQTKLFHKMMDKQKIKLPKGICSGLSDEQYEKLYLSTIIHEKPLKNALGEDFKKILTKEKVIELFKKM